MNRIPRILHQTWKDRDVPRPWRGFQRGWQLQHPGWEYRFWTDEDLRELVRIDAPAFLASFDAYRDPICRADAGRYLVLRRHGGLYVDLDFECLRPIDPLLAGKEFVVGEEPARHLEIPAVARRAVPHVLCNALLASTPQHPFWEFLLGRLQAHRNEPDPLDSTGPFLLTRAIAAYPEVERLTIASAAEIYPLDKFQVRARSAAKRTERLRAEGRAFALHHWAGTWVPREECENWQAQATAQDLA